MTHNQIEYAKLQETKRSNLVTEGETNRHNIVTENETNRHNLATESNETQKNIINQAHYERLDTETARHNAAQEAIAQQDSVSKRLSAQADATNASTRQYEAEIARQNSITNVINAQTNRLQAETQQKVGDSTVSRNQVQNTTDLASTVRQDNLAATQSQLNTSNIALNSQKESTLKSESFRNYTQGSKNIVDSLSRVLDAGTQVFKTIMLKK